jgi:hypothetical protein
VTKAQIEYMVSRFLSWKLPSPTSRPTRESASRRRSTRTRLGPADTSPTGTNLFDATQAEAMVRHMTEGMPK